MKCVACGDHPLNYIHCDRWDCPLLMVRAAIERIRLCDTVTVPLRALIPDEADDCADSRRPADNDEYTGEDKAEIISVMKACIELVERSELADLAEEYDEHPDQDDPA